MTNNNNNHNKARTSQYTGKRQRTPPSESHNNNNNDNNCYGTHSSSSSLSSFQQSKYDRNKRFKPNHHHQQTHYARRHNNNNNQYNDNNKKKQQQKHKNKQSDEEQSSLEAIQKFKNHADLLRHYTSQDKQREQLFYKCYLHRIIQRSLLRRQQKKQEEREYNNNHNDGDDGAADENLPILQLPTDFQLVIASESHEVNQWLEQYVFSVSHHKKDASSSTSSTSSSSKSTTSVIRKRTRDVEQHVNHSDEKKHDGSQRRNRRHSGNDTSDSTRDDTDSDDGSLKSVSGKFAVGIDCEWDSFRVLHDGQVIPSVRMPDVITVSTEKSCLLYKVFEGNIEPSSLFIRLIKDTRITKVWYDYSNDIPKLSHWMTAHWGAQVVEPVIRALREGSFDLSKLGRGGVNSICEQYLSHSLKDDAEGVRIERWSRVHLTQQQVQYACKDAFVNMKIYKKAVLKEGEESASKAEVTRSEVIVID